jgi:hypothetical protein
VTGQLHPDRVAEARQPLAARCGRSLPKPPMRPARAQAVGPGPEWPYTGRNQNVAVLPDLGKLHPTKSAGDARCRSPLAAAM